MLTHDKIESNIGIMIVLIILLVSVGGMVEIVPLFFSKSTTEPVAGLKPYDAARLVGRDIYIREGCYNCHSQMIRPFRAETERYGHYSVAGEFVYDHPFQWGSKRTGPDLARVGGRYSDEWHRAHLKQPRDVVPESNMPAYYWLDRLARIDDIEAKMKALRMVGVPYTDQDIAGALEQLKGKTELDVLIAYLQGMGTLLKADPMIMDINDLRALSTVVMFAVFIAIVCWAYSGKRKQAFEEAALLPFSDDELVAAAKPASSRPNERKAS